VSRVQAHHLTPVPGRESDRKDGQWRQDWHTGGRLSASFRPEAEMCAVRASVRHRALWLAERAAPLQPRQKALHQRNVPLSPVLTDRTGVTGVALIRAIVAGARAPVHLARFREPRCASRPEDIAKAVTGHSHPAHVFALKQALALSAASPAPGRECGAAIERRCRAMKPVGPDAPPPPNRANHHRTPTKKAPGYDARGVLDQRTGVDLVAIPGVHASAVQPLPSETGLALRKWPSAKALCAWLGRAPRHELAGGKSWRRSTLKTRHRAGRAFRRAAPAVSRRPKS
jgi:transposase